MNPSVISFPPSVQLRFQPKENHQRLFFTTLKKRIDDYFIANQLTHNATYSMLFKMVFILGVFYTTYLSILFVPIVTEYYYLAMVILGFFGAFIGLNIGHEAIHGSLFKEKWLNKLLALNFYFVGADVYVWNITHNVVHHTYTNVHGHDADLDQPFFLRISPHTPWHPVHRYQHIYAFIAYALSTISWVFKKDYHKFFQKQTGGYVNRGHKPVEYIKLFGFKVLYYSMFLVLPVVLTPLTFGQVLLGFVIMHAIQGLMLSIIFQLAHAVQEVEYPVPDDNGIIENTWAIHQLHTTANFARKNKLLTYFLGGLNYQIEHHLFPNICHVHYPALSEIVSQTAEEFGLPYHDTPTMTEAVRSHYNLLKRLGSNA